MLSQAIQIDPDCVEAYFIRGVAYIYFKYSLTNQNSLQKAIKDFQTVIEINAEYPKAQEYLKKVKTFV